MADSDESPIVADSSSPADSDDSFSPILVDSSTPADSDDSLSPMAEDSDDSLSPMTADSDDSLSSIAADSSSPIDALKERMEAGVYQTSEAFVQATLDLVRVRPLAELEPVHTELSPEPPSSDSAEELYSTFQAVDPNESPSTSDDPSDESLGMVDDQVSIPIRRKHRLDFESYVPELVRNEIKKIFRKYKNDLIDFDKFELGILNRIKECPEAVEKFKLLLPDDPNKEEFYDRVRTELYLKEADISKYIEWLTDLDQYTDGVMSVKDFKNKTSTYLAGYPDLYNCVQSIEEEPKDADENKEEPKDTDENKEEPKDTDENKD